MLRRLLVSLVVLLGTLAVSAGGAQAAGFGFSAPAALPGSPPAGDRQGGEPSAVFDPRQANLLYAGAPGGPGPGGSFWRSTDGGKTFSQGMSVGSSLGGGDSDIAVGYDAPHTVFYADLEDLVASDLCLSTDRGQTFTTPGCAQGLPSQQEDPASDRPWVTTVPGQPNLLYDTYDGLAFHYPGGGPQVDVSTDQGRTFATCSVGGVLAPGSQAFLHQSPTGAAENSLTIGKPAVDGADGTLYVPFTQPHVQNQIVVAADDPTPGNLYMAIARGGCTPTSPAFFENSTVYQNDPGDGTPGESNFVSIFPSVAVGPDGTVFAVGAGKTGDPAIDQGGEGVFLFVSRDRGRTWGPPIKVNDSGPHAIQLAALDAGLGAGEAILGWYESDTTARHQDPGGRWRYHVAETFDFGRTFQRTIVTPGTFHYGDICNAGVLCGVTADTGQNRNLLDFTTVRVNPATGCGFAIFGGDPFDTPQNGKTTASAAYTSVQTGGRCLTASNSGKTMGGKPGAGGGNPGTGGGQGNGGNRRRGLHLAVHPRRTHTGCHRYRFRVTTGHRGHRRPVRRAVVTFRGRHGTSGRRGYTHISRCTPHAGRYRARAHKSGFRPATAHVTVVRRRSSPAFTG